MDIDRDFSIFLTRIFLEQNGMKTENCIVSPSLEKKKPAYPIELVWENGLKTHNSPIFKKYEISYEKGEGFSKNDVSKIIAFSLIPHTLYPLYYSKQGLQNEMEELQKRFEKTQKIGILEHVKKYLERKTRILN